MQDIKELNLVELQNTLQKWGESGFHAEQIFSWIYKKGVGDFAAMSDLSLALRKKLEDNFFLNSLKLVEALKSKDGTEKFLFQLKDRNFIETVAIPTEKRLTLCLSTQVGCKFRCCFCASGMLGFKRNLTSAEIIEQVLYVKNNFSDKVITHLVFMGIGEPLDNYDELIKAIRIVNSKAAFNIGARRMTISTSGIIPAIKRLREEELQIELSISLHAADNQTRSRIMPVNKKYPLVELIKTCSEYIKQTGRQITFEYILMKGVNSSLQNAQDLSKIVKSLVLCKVNLILLNPIKNCAIAPPSKLEILLFRDYLLRQGLNVTLRQRRGADIEAACGQLRLRYVKE